MPVHEVRKPPTGHGEVVCSPPFERWADLSAENARAVPGWPEELRRLRASAREETRAEAKRYSRSIGVGAQPNADRDLIVMTGHQPELYHPGIWVKDFLVQRLSDDIGAFGLDVVVDSDASEPVTLKTPCFADGVHRCETLLSPGVPGAAYAQTPVPDAQARVAFRAAGQASLRTLPAPALLRHFDVFCDALEQAVPGSSEVATLMTAARRRYEVPSGTDYLEILASEQARSNTFRRFAASVCLDARRFRDVTNAMLAEYRERTGTRFLAQPFPDLDEFDGRVEVPFWLLHDGRRLTVSVDARGTLFADEEAVLDLGRSADAGVLALARAEAVLVPKAMTLTLFERLFVADLFVHGIGGGRYDRVTDMVIQGYFGVQPPAFAVASMTLLLPLGGEIVTDAEVTAAERRLHRLEHNPDSMLQDLEFDSGAERTAAQDLADRKAALVEAIAAPGADKKRLGAEIREVNSALGALLAPIAADLRAAVARLRDERDASDILTDRTYPYCLWDPREVMDKVR